MFGNNSFTNTSFGNTSFGGGFGTTPTLGAFGSTTQAPAQSAGPVGTTIRFVPLTGTDSIQKAGSSAGPSQITTRHQIISAMKEYESKSVDELRLEDYAANRKVGQPQTAFTQSTPFGSMQPSTSQQGTSIFGSSAQPAPSLFATPTQNQSTSIFGQQKTGFGVTSSSSNLFGSPLNKPTTTVASSPFSIGAPFNSNTSGGFLGSTQGTTQTQPQTAFGQSTPFGSMQPSTSQQGTSIFGSSAQPAPSLFATPTQNQSSSIFGQPKPTGFGVTSSSSNLFGSTLNKPTTTVASSPFNIGAPFNSNTSGGFLGSTQNATQPQTQTAFSQSSPFGSMQPSTSQQGTSIFGTGSQPAPSLFATPTQNQSSSIFGQPKPTGFGVTSSSSSTNLFGSPMNKPITTVASSPFNIGAPFSSNTSGGGFLGSTQSAPQSQPQTAFNQTSPFGSLQTSTSQPGTSLFGSSTQPTPSLFSTPTQNQSTSIFGQPKTDFGVASSTSNLFGSTLNMPTATVASSPFNSNTSGGFLGSTHNATLSQPQTSNLFNSPPQSQPTTFSPDTSRSSSDLLLNRLKTLPYGETSVLSDSESRYTTSPKIMNQFKMNAKTSVKLNKTQTTEKDKADTVLFDGSDQNTTDLKCAIDVFVPKKTQLEISQSEVEQQAKSSMKTLNTSELSSFNEPITTVANSPPTNGASFNSNNSVSSLNSTQSAIHPQPQSAFNTSTPFSGSRQQSTSPQNTSVLDSSVQAPPSIFNATSTQNQSTNITGQSKTDFNLANSPSNLFNSPKSHPASTVRSQSSLLLDRHEMILHRTKRLAPQNASPALERPMIAGVLPPKQQKMREIKLKPDLYAATNKSTRDIMSVCAVGCPKVRFFNGSRNIVLIQADTVVIQELKLVPEMSEDLETRLETFLEKNSTVTPIPSLAPYVETHDFIEEASSGELLYALYGNLSSKTPYAKQDERLNRLISWLASINSKLPEPTNLYQLIMYHMSCDRYDLASSLAVEKHHPRLAMLVATLNLNKDAILGQLSSWRLSTADQYIDQELLKIYILLSGLTEWKLSNGIIIYSLKGLKWTQQLCLLALHLEAATSGFQVLPLLMSRLDTNTNDVEYHILARHSPADIVSAAASLVEEWFLVESLKSYNVSHHQESDFDVIHCNLASQVGAIDLRWACFFALHISNNEVRNQILTKCLTQNSNQLHDSTKSWLTEKLKIPKEFM